MTYRLVDAAVYSQRQAVASGVDRIEHLVEVLRGVADDVQDRSEDLVLEAADAIERKERRRDEDAAAARFGQTDTMQQAALRCDRCDVGFERVARCGIDDRPHIGREQRGIADRELVHRSTKQLDHGRRDVVLHEQHAQSRAALARAVER